MLVALKLVLKLALARLTSCQRAFYPHLVLIASPFSEKSESIIPKTLFQNKIIPKINKWGLLFFFALYSKSDRWV